MRHLEKAQLFAQASKNVKQLEKVLCDFSPSLLLQDASTGCSTIDKAKAVLIYSSLVCNLVPGERHIISIPCQLQMWSIQVAEFTTNKTAHKSSFQCQKRPIKFYNNDSAINLSILKVLDGQAALQPLTYGKQSWDMVLKFDDYNLTQALWNLFNYSDW